MSTIAHHSHWPIGPAILAGAVLSAMCISPGSTLAQHDSPAAADAQQTRLRFRTITTGFNSDEHPGTDVHFRAKLPPAANPSI